MVKGSLQTRHDGDSDSDSNTEYLSNDRTSSSIFTIVPNFEGDEYQKSDNSHMIRRVDC